MTSTLIRGSTFSQGLNFGVGYFSNSKAPRLQCLTRDCLLVIISEYDCHPVVGSSTPKMAIFSSLFQYLFQREGEYRVRCLGCVRAHSRLVEIGCTFA